MATVKDVQNGDPRKVLSIREAFGILFGSDSYWSPRYGSFKERADCVKYYCQIHKEVSQRRGDK